MLALETNVSTHHIHRDGKTRAALNIGYDGCYLCWVVYDFHGAHHIGFALTLSVETIQEEECCRQCRITNWTKSLWRVSAIRKVYQNWYKAAVMESLKQPSLPLLLFPLWHFVLHRSIHSGDGCPAIVDQRPLPPHRSWNRCGHLCHEWIAPSITHGVLRDIWCRLDIGLFANTAW